MAFSLPNKEDQKRNKILPSKRGASGTVPYGKSVPDRNVEINRDVLLLIFGHSTKKIENNTGIQG